MLHPDLRPFAPIPGTEPPRRAFFVDRWGTLLVQPERGYCTGSQDLRFIDGAVDALFRACRAGWSIYLLGNEEEVAFGKLEEETWWEIEAAILEHLSGQGVLVARSYACLDHPEGKGRHRLDSVYLLPNTGAFYHAAHADGIELARSWVIGDSTVELVAGWRSGCRLAGVRTGVGLADRRFEVQPELIAEDMGAAVTELLSLEGARVP